MLLLWSRCKELVLVGTASVLAWFGIVGLSFTQDSLARINNWMLLGILIGLTDSLA